MNKLARIIGGLLVVVLLLLPTTQVLAIADPDDPPQITAVYVFEDLLEDGDLGVLIDYYIDYAIAGIPDETVTEAYLASFIDIDGTTQISTVAPYTFVYTGYTDKGYSRGMVWIYFTAAEVTAASIDDANEALHTVWLMGNPTIESGWTGDPPKTIAGIDEWWATGEGDPAVLLALRVLYLAGQLELAWGFDMIETTPLGSRLTSIGEGYFPNVIASLRTMAPTCFSVAEYTQVQEDLDYSTAFGAIMTDGTGTCVGSPITLAEGDNTVDITGAGTFILELEKGTVGEAVSIAGGCTVTGSPAALVYGLNTITTNLAGTNDITVTVNLADTTSALEDIGAGWVDLTEVATEFGMTRWMFGGLTWMVISIIICAAVYGMGDRQLSIRSGSGKGVLLMFNVCIIGGTMLGLLNPIIAILLFMGFGFLTAYVLFFRHASF